MNLLFYIFLVALAFMTFGPIGGLLALVFGGSLLRWMSSGKDDRKNPVLRESYVNKNEVMLAMLILTAVVMSVDGKVTRAELDFVKRKLLSRYGTEATQTQLLILRKILKEQQSVDAACSLLRQHTSYPMRLELLSDFFELAMVDGSIQMSEHRLIKTLSVSLGLRQTDFEAVYRYFSPMAEKNPYVALNVSREASDEEIKKAYRRLAITYHPDKVAHRGENTRKEAEVKFQEMNEAFQQIKRERGFV